MLADTPLGADVSSVRQRASAPALVLLIAFGGTLAVLLGSTHHGTRVMGADWIRYVAAARELLAGNGLSFPDGMGGLQPLVHWPPAFPLALASLSVLGLEPHVAARVLNSLLLGVNACLVAILLHRARPGARHLPVAGALGCVVWVNMLKRHSEAMSEPLFIFFVLLAFLFLHAYLRSQARGMLLLTSAALGISVLTRYLGIAAVAACVVAVIVRGRGSPTRRLGAALLLALVAASPMGLWSVRNRIVAGQYSSRTIRWHPPGAAHVAVAWATLATTLVPSSAPAWVKHCGAVGSIFVAAALVLGWVFLVRRSRRSLLVSAGPIETLLLAFVAAYLAALLASIALFERVQYPDERLLFPPLLATLMLLGILVADIDELLPVDWVKRLGAAVIVLLLAVSGLRAGAWVVLTKKHGWGGYLTPSWQNSSTLEYVLTRIPPASPIVSNDSEAIYFFAKRPAYQTPLYYYEIDADAPPWLQAGDRTVDLPGAWRRLLQHVPPGQFYLVLFYEDGNPPGEATSDVALSGGAPVARLGDGRIYIAQSTARPPTGPVPTQ